MMNNYYFCVKVINNLNILIMLLYKSNNYSEICRYNNQINMNDLFLIKKKLIITKEIDRNYHNRYLRVYEKPFFKDNQLELIHNNDYIGSLNYHIINNNLRIVNLTSNNDNYKLLLAFIYFCINIAKNKKISNLIFNINISIEFYFILFKSFQFLIYNIKYYNDKFILFNGSLSFLNK